MILAAQTGIEQQFAALAESGFALSPHLIENLCNAYDKYFLPASSGIQFDGGSRAARRSRNDGRCGEGSIAIAGQRKHTGNVGVRHACAADDSAFNTASVPAPPSCN